MKNPVPKGKMRIIGETAGKPTMYLAGDGSQKVNEMTMVTLWNGQEWIGWQELGSFLAHLRTGVVKSNKSLKDVGLKYPTEISARQPKGGKR